MSSLAIKCLPPLVKGASERAAEEVINGLCDKLATTGKDQQQQRDVGTIGLKTVVADLGMGTFDRSRTRTTFVE